VEWLILLRSCEGEILGWIGAIVLSKELEMSSVGQLQAETIGRPGLLDLWILGKKQIHEVLGVVIMRLVAVAGHMIRN